MDARSQHKINQIPKYPCSKFSLLNIFPATILPFYIIFIMHETQCMVTCVQIKNRNETRSKIYHKIFYVTHGNTRCKNTIQVTHNAQTSLKTNTPNNTNNSLFVAFYFYFPFLQGIINWVQCLLNHTHYSIYIILLYIHFSLHHMESTCYKKGKNRKRNTKRKKEKKK